MDTCDRLIELWSLLQIRLIAGNSLHNKLISAGFPIFENANDMSCLAYAAGHTRATGQPAAVVMDLSTCSIADATEALHDAKELPLFVLLTTPSAKKFECVDLTTHTYVFPPQLNRLLLVSCTDMDKEMSTPIPTLPAAKKSVIPYLDPRMVQLRCYIESCFRPVLLVGDGVSSIVGFPKTIPMVATRHSIGIIPQNHFFMGRFGHDGDRVGNFIVQNADLVIVIGALEIDHPEWFVREGHVVWVHDSHQPPSFTAHLHFTHNPFMDEWVRFKRMSISDWLSICQRWKKQSMLVLPPSCHESPKVHPYVLQCLVHQVFPEKKTIIARTDDHWWLPIFQHHMSGRLLCTSMPDVVFFSASIAKETDLVLVFLGDKDCFRLEDLQYIVENNLPIILFGLHPHHPSYGFQGNDKGFLDRLDQPTASADDVLTLEQISDMTGLRTQYTDNHDDLLVVLQNIVSSLPLKEPLLVDVETDPSFTPIPKGSKDKPYEVMEPLDLAEIHRNMIIRPVL